MFLRARYEFINLATDVTPYFANLINVSGKAGITGNNQDPANWGPPGAVVLERPGVGLATGQLRAQRQPDATAASTELFSQPRPPQPDVRRRPAATALDVLSQQDARGGFSFTGAATRVRSRRLPARPAADRARSHSATPTSSCGRTWSKRYVNDDYRVSPSLTLNLGVRWEFESPMTESPGPSGEPRRGARLHAPRNR